MKKTLLALAVMGAFAGTAQAQQTDGVTIYGSIDGGVRYKSNVNAAGDKLWSEGDVSSGVKLGTYNTNRLGFKGVEDLGGGMNAHFVLENGFDAGTGTLDNGSNRLFNRTALVGITTPVGNFDLGRQYSVSFKMIGQYDPFNYHYITIIPLASAAAGSPGSISATAPTGTQGGTRFNNDLQYTAKFGPALVMAEYAFGETAGETSGNSAFAVGGAYTAGPITVGGAYTRKKPSVPVAGGATSFEDNNQWTVGGSFKTEAFRVAVGYIDDKQERGLPGFDDNRVRNAWAGVSVNITPAFELTGAFYQTRVNLDQTPTVSADGKRNLFIVGGTYALSKRTVLYTEVDYAKLHGIARVNPTGAGGLAPLDNQKGVSIGINHLF
ncbi:porin [Noviherbaspirillum massiliense]|uniref:porin n=1 Tax=Noviherbaspirillum massiliense TaxID=1465823 RepID=UPI0002DBD630|nr:porin [Noviherbaspirillum massiliense]